MRKEQGNITKNVRLFSFWWIGCGNGIGTKCSNGPRLDNWIRNGGPADTGRVRLHQPDGVNLPVVPLHQIASPEDAGCLHMQRVRPAHDTCHQPPCLH